MSTAKSGVQACLTALSDCQRTGGRRQSGRVWRTFCRPDIKFIEHYVCRGTKLIGDANLYPVTKLVGSIGAVPWYRLSRSQKFVTVQKFAGEQMSVSGCPASRNFLKSRKPRKNRDKKMTFIGSVRLCTLL
jgi:hypothetical protein